MTNLLTNHTIKPHYPLMTRLLLDLYAQGELPHIVSIDVEPEYGYAGRIVYANGGVRLFRRTNTGINNHGASEIAKDKGYTKYFLHQLGYATPPGKVFLLPDYLHTIERNLSRFGVDSYAGIEQINDYIQSEVGYPCFLKPNDGTKGIGIFKCHTPTEIVRVVDGYQQDGVKLALVEQMVTMPDYRVLVLRDEVICCYQRFPLALVGDGTHTITELLELHQQHLAKTGRRTRIAMDDGRIQEKLQRLGHTLKTVLPHGERVEVYDISNLSVGGTAKDCTALLHPYWQTLCIQVTAAMGLSLCGVDLACADIGDPKAAYSILELNSSPGLANYVALGPAQRDVVRNMYRQVFGVAPENTPYFSDTEAEAEAEEEAEEATITPCCCDTPIVQNNTPPIMIGSSTMICNSTP
jgi:D-alanine-D-alanine ligase-like ATP-grasp enzyme